MCVGTVRQESAVPHSCSWTSDPATTWQPRPVNEYPGSYGTAIATRPTVRNGRSWTASPSKEIQIYPKDTPYTANATNILDEHWKELHLRERR